MNDTASEQESERVTDRNASISVIIPNWNGAQHLPTCLNSLRRQTLSPTEVIVVDNASTDGSQELIARDYPEVKLLALSENRGFTGACNAGLRRAEGEFLVLLNNDTEVSSDWLAGIADAFHRHSEAGIIASKMLLFEQRDVFHTAGDLYGKDGIPKNRGVWQNDEGQYDGEEYVFSACGGAAAYRRQMLKEVGLLDEEFFFSCEDIDLAWRAQLAGWRCLYTPQAVVYHRLSATGGGETASFHDGRNFIYVVAKNYPSSLLRKYWRRVVRAQLKIAWDALKAWRGPSARARLRGQLAGLLTLPKVLRKRKQVQDSRSVTDEYLEAILDG